VDLFISKEKVKNIMREASETPPDLILRAREMEKHGEFHRKVVSRRPKDLDVDIVELECGHTSLTCFPDRSDALCRECRDKWVEEHRHD